VITKDRSIGELVKDNVLLGEIPRMVFESFVLRVGVISYTEYRLLGSRITFGYFVLTD
ncbi:hypothetical protein LCGC14_2669990, partial [marine sediment metagenome]